jgi:putative ABC transport system permease protein
MAIPLSYNVRNLRVRTGATVMTALGIALTVSIAVFIMALLRGLERAFVTTGDPLNVVVMRKGADAEMMSAIQRPSFPVLRALPGVAKNPEGLPMAAGEMMVVIVLPRKDGTGETNVNVRGTMPIAFELRPEIKLMQGRWFQPGQREVVVSDSIRRRFVNSDVGNQMRFGKGEWAVVGVFDGGGTARESEIWADVNLMAADFNRPIYSSVLLRATDPLSADALVHRVSDDQRLKLQGLPEPEYYAKQTRSGMSIQYVGTIVAVIMAIGSSFAAMNTMYAAVAYRAREIATLRVLGFSRPSILTSFVLESLLLALVGGSLGILLVLPFHGLTTGTQNMMTFSEVVFSIRVTPGVIATAVLFAACLGVFGGLAPAWHAARQNILSALRD